MYTNVHLDAFQKYFFDLLCAVALFPTIECCNHLQVCIYHRPSEAENSVITDKVAINIVTDVSM